MDCSTCVHDGCCDGLPYCGGRGYEPADEADDGDADYDYDYDYDFAAADEAAAERWLARNEP